MAKRKTPDRTYRGFKPNLESVGLTHPQAEQLKLWKMEKRGLPAPSFHNDPVAVWFGQRYTAHFETPVIAALMPYESLKNSATQWFFGIVRQKMLLDNPTPIVTIVEAAEFPVDGTSSRQRLSLAIDTLSTFLPAEYFDDGTYLYL